MARILNSQPDAMARFNYEIPEELERMVRKCLEKDRDRRYQSARELLVDLQESGARFGLAATRVVSGAQRAILTAVIVDDEELARALLREYRGVSTGVEIVAECANGFEAVKAIAEKKPDLVFLDVQMPKLDGFEVLELIGPRGRGDLRHRLRSVRHASLRRARRGLSAEAVQPRSVSKRRWNARASGWARMRHPARNRGLPATELARARGLRSEYCSASW